VSLGSACADVIGTSLSGLERQGLRVTLANVGCLAHRDKGAEVLRGYTDTAAPSRP
jgi:hypothetical protein